jgi:hypothetical protein
MFDKNAPIFFKYVGGSLVLWGLYIVAGRFLFDAWIRRNTYYAVTDKRILILRSFGPFSKITALSFDQLPDASLSEKTDGRGTIRLGPPLSLEAWLCRSSRKPYSWTLSLDRTPHLIEIEDARRVFDLIQRRCGVMPPGPLADEELPR